MASTTRTWDIVHYLQDGFQKWWYPRPEYSRLDESKHEIRLLKILPIRNDSADSSLVECTFAVASLQDGPRFAALSYTWGSWSNFKTIRINGKTVAVTDNLHGALIMLRQKDVPETYVWVDALCINQHENDERAIQIARMRQIYKQAEVVRVWLGPEQQWTSHVFEALQDIKSQAQRLDAVGWRRLVEGYDNLARRRWFTRLWVLQEVILGRKVVCHCGSVEMEFWNLLHNMSDFKMILVAGMSSSSSVTETGVKKSEGAASVLLCISRWGDLSPFLDSKDFPSTTADSRSVIRHFGRLSALNCSIDHDRIYGLLGLVPPSLKIPVTYGSPVEEIFEQGALQLISWSQSLELLRHAGILEKLPDEKLLSLSIRQITVWDSKSPHDVEKNVLRCPSWVPQWFHESLNMWNQNNGKDLEKFDAARSIPFLAKQPRRGELIVHAKIVDLVSHILPSTSGDIYTYLSNRDPPLEALQFFRNWRTAYSKIDPPSSKDEQSLSFWRTLSFDSQLNLDLAAQVRDPSVVLEKKGRTGAKFWWTRKWQSDDVIVAQAFDQWLQEPFPLTQELRIALANGIPAACLLFTSAKRIGMVPFQAREGDIIALLGGLGMPALLRPKPIEGKSAYEFVGTCYCDGIMYGEAVSPSIGQPLRAGPQDSFETISLV